MATSFVVVGSTQKRVGGYHWKTRALYTDKATTDNGEWISTVGMKYCTFVVNGITTGTVLFRAWNGATAPAATEHGEACYGIATSGATLVAQLTADGVIAFPEHMLPMYIKAYISVATTITLDVDMKALIET